MKVVKNNATYPVTAQVKGGPRVTFLPGDTPIGKDITAEHAKAALTMPYIKGLLDKGILATA